MDRRDRDTLDQLTLRNQIRFLIYLYWLKIGEVLYSSRSYRSKIHWLGHAHRPRRLERLLFIILLFVSMIVLEPHQYMLWAIAWGGGASLFVIVKTILMLKPAKA